MVGDEGISETAVLVFRRPVNQQGFMQREVMVLNGGYTMRIGPTAIGTDVVPMLKRLRNGTTPGTSQPRATPNTMAAKIHPVR
jgi:hypothetical protein